jgi:hypothetical protein
MSKETDKTTPSRWMIQGAAVSSERFLKHLQTDPNIREVRWIASDVVVVSMPAASAERLKAEFRDLRVEPDTELEMFT